ncbi:relaxase/mobilization nuclease domain-containing protein [Deefgea rivuli]|uniref:relaxase/mobilization nuclease domain-containing protein n=1 Tax=Deefgea rivuli TaxID=400948 RepID=UPI000686260D|nr:relaxase/mobilization nuclease domain-containing protein [Deefgea rivuli]
MLIKFLPHGSGDASKAAAYVLDEADHLNVRREGVSVLRGNLQLFAAIANNLPFRQRYTSGVVAWAEGDAPTDEDIEAVLNEFERVAFAGLDPDEYQLNVVQHVEPNGSKHVHILVPRVNLRSKKSLNIAPPGWEGLFYPLRNAWNNEQGWARPDDPLRKRDHCPDFHAYIDAAALRAGLQVEPQSRSELTKFIKQQVENGQIKHCDDVLLELQQFGKVNRSKKGDYIRVIPPGFDKGLRLKGAFFEADFDPAIWIANEQQRGKNQNRYSGREKVTLDHQKRAKQARRELAEAVEKRRQYHQDRYHRPAKGVSDQAVIPDREVGADADPMAALDQLQIPNKGNTSDGIREDSYSAAQSAGRAVCEASDGVSNAAAKLGATIERHDRATERDGQRVRAVARESGRAAQIIRQLDEHNRDELVRFKTDVSLIAVAKSYGYLPQKNGSTPGSVLLKKGSETLLCVTNSDNNNYEQYYNLTDGHDSGSVIDFVQRREPHLNLGQIRRKLRLHLKAMTSDRLAEFKPRAVSRQHIIQALEWHRLPPYQGDLLQHQFHIDGESIEVFADKLRQNESGLPCFRHVDRTSIVGYEIETGSGIVFSTSGPAGLFTHRIGQDVDRVVIVSSAVEAMAYHQLNAQEDTVYIGLGNALSESQLGMLFGYFARDDRQKTPVVIALSHTEQALKFAERIQAERPSASCVWPNSVTWSDELGRSVGKKPVRNKNARIEVRHDLNSDSYPRSDFDVDW